MALYFFDITNGGPQRDDTGTECATREDVRWAAMQVLPDIAREYIKSDGDSRFFKVVARDEAGAAVITATLSYSAMWLDERPE